MYCIGRTPEPVRGTVLLIDDGLHMGYLVKEALRRIEQHCVCDLSGISAAHVLPDHERAMDAALATIDSMERFLAQRTDTILACLLDCHLHSSPLERSIELQQTAAAGLPPFGLRFRSIPMAMLTAVADIADIRHRATCTVFQKCVCVGDGVDLCPRLVYWLRNAIGIL